jgi:protein-disulfide isomerase
MSRTKVVLVACVVILAIATVVMAKKAAESNDSEASAATSKADVAAYVGDDPITVQEIDELLAGELLKLRQQEYELRRRAVDRIVADRLFTREAASREMTVDELFEAEIAVKTPDPSDGEVEQFYEENKNRYQQLRGKSFEESKEMIRAQIRQQNGLARQTAFLDQLRASVAVRYLFDPPRVALTVPEGEPSIGPENAPVTIVEFSDFQCGYCRRVHPTVEQVLAEYGDKVRFVYRDFALDFHPRAAPAAKAARCAGDQGKYWEYHNNLFQRPGTLDDGDLMQRATDLGLDQAAFTACYESDRYDAAIQAGLEDGQSVGVTGTPTFFINGRAIVGAVPLDQIKAIIDEELARAGESSDEG